MDYRRGQFKYKAKDGETMRRQRQETTVNLRKEKRDTVLAKRRLISLADHGDAGSSNAELSSLVQIRKKVSVEELPSINELLEQDIMPMLLSGLDSSDPAIVYEATWALTNITSGSSMHTLAVVEAGVVPRLINLMQCSASNITQQAIWTIGNIVGDDSTFLRDCCIIEGLLEPLLKLALSDQIPASCLKIIVWVIMNLCRVASLPLDDKYLEQIVHALSYLIHSKDDNVLVDTIWTLSYIAEVGVKQIQLIVDNGLIEIIVPFLNHGEETIESAALRAISNVVTGTNAQTQLVLDYGMMGMIGRFLQDMSSIQCKEATWCISNIAAGPESQIQTIIDNHLLPELLNILINADFRIQVEACWVVANMAGGGSFEQLTWLIRLGFVHPLCNILKCNETKSLVAVLCALTSMLRKLTSLTEVICEQIEECGGMDLIDHLQQHENAKVFKLAYDIMTEYFAEYDEEPDDFEMSYPAASAPAAFNI